MDKLLQVVVLCPNETIGNITWYSQSREYRTGMKRIGRAEEYLMASGLGATRRVARMGNGEGARLCPGPATPRVSLDMRQRA